jgi:hypothetical protein
LLEEVLADRRARGLLGKDIMGVDGFDFDLRVQMGAGAYICGEEGALISSCEGLPGEPKTRPPFPVNRGYLGYPTVVNNVETFCHAARILDRGAKWFFDMGSDGSHGTKLFSVSGDCLNPGIYELPYGLEIRELLEMVGGEDAAAVQVGGPSGTMIARDSFHRRLTFDDLATGGAIIVFSGERNVLEIVEYYMSFFVHESCGYCTPCRVGNVFLQKAIGKFRKGLANPGGHRLPEGPLGHDHRDEPLRSRHDVAQSHPHDARELSARLFGDGQAVEGQDPGDIRYPVGHRRRAQSGEAPLLHLRQGFFEVSDQEITFTIDGVEITAKSGQTIMEAADEAGIYIPRLCDHEGLRHQGGCRVCTVKANGRSVSACTQPAAPG